MFDIAPIVQSAKRIRGNRLEHQYVYVMPAPSHRQGSNGKMRRVSDACRLAVAGCSAAVRGRGRAQRKKTMSR